MALLFGKPLQKYLLDLKNIKVMIKSPYNFVPLNKEVFFPYWSAFVSQDVPFEKSLSGKIKLIIEAETPLFIRGDENTNAQDRRYKEFHFKKLNGKYCIPGTSIKGELESVLENLSFAKLQLYNKDKFGFRDWINDELYNKAQFARCFGGWMTKNENGEYYIKYNSIQKPGRIEYTQIDSIFKTDFVNTFGLNFNNDDDNDDNENIEKSAKKKYELINNQSLEKKFSISYTSHNRDVYIEDENGEEGTIVFTGQSSKRRPEKGVAGNGKGLDFIFWTGDKTIQVGKQTIENFFLAYFDNKDKLHSIDWQYWKTKLDNKEKIPVFFLKDEKGKVKHLGLSMLYRLPYQFGISDLINRQGDHEKSGLDLIDTIFGCVNKDDQENEASKGRVSIEPALNVNDAEEGTMVTKILGSPKASFYPFYIWQNPNAHNRTGRYKTYNDVDAEIAGRKRYPVQKEALNGSVPPSDTTTSFYPLARGAKFETFLHYHNLRPVELGAVLSALTFHKNNDKCHHSLGMAKPYGFGNVRISIDFIKSDISETELDNYLSIFEKVMTNRIPNWINSEQLKELFCIATPMENNQMLKYPVLDPTLHTNDFSDIKQQKEALPRYSAFMEMNYTGYNGNIKETEFNVEADKKKFVVDTNLINQTLAEFKKEKSDSLIQHIKDEIENIKIEIDKEREAIKQKGIEDYPKKYGISILLEQTSMNNLISKTNTWISKYYSKINQKKNTDNGIPAIPDEHQNSFLNHVTSLFISKQTDRTWRLNKGIENCVGYNYLVKCVGRDKANEWFKNQNLI